jgi:ribonuclease G
MSEELLVNVTPRETRVAVVENGMLQELHIERGSQRGVVGNIYKGKVQRVMPGMQAAFVDIGLDRAAFLHANDIFRSAQLGRRRGRRRAGPPPSMQVQVPITELLRDGAGDRGAGGQGSDRQQGRAADHPDQHPLALHGAAAALARARHFRAHRGRRAERARLKALMTELARPAAHGYIVRTNAEGQPAEALAEDIAYLARVGTGRSDLGRRMPRSAAACTKTSACRCARCAT